MQKRLAALHRKSYCPYAEKPPQAVSSPILNPNCRAFWNGGTDRPHSRYSYADDRGPAWPPARRCNTGQDRHGPRYPGTHRSSPDFPSG